MRRWNLPTWHTRAGSTAEKLIQVIDGTGEIVPVGDNEF